MLASARLFAVRFDEHVEQHAADRFKHTARELVSVGRGHDPARRQIQRDHTHPAQGQFGLELLPLGIGQPRQSVDLFQQKYVAGLAVIKRSE